MKVRVKNFQSLKDAEIEVEGLTVISGPNNAGKSAFVRALTGAFQNAPGDHFIRTGTSETSVSVDLGDRSLAWTKNRKKASYVIDNQDPISPGRGAIPEVADLGVSPLDIGGLVVWPNIAKQITGQVFLLDASGPVLAEAIANPEVIGKLNAALKGSESDRRVAQSSLKVALDERDQLAKTVSGFDGFSLVESFVTALEARRELLVSDEGTLQKVEELSATRVARLTDWETLRPVMDMAFPDCTPSISTHEVDTLQALADNRRSVFQDAEFWKTAPSCSLEEAPSTGLWAFTEVTSKERNRLISLTYFPLISIEEPPSWGEVEAVSHLRDTRNSLVLQALDVPEVTCRETTAFRILEGIDRVQGLSARRKELARLTETVEVDTLPVPLPGWEEVLELASRRQQLTAQIRDFEVQIEGLPLPQLEVELETLLREFPPCPTCGQLHRIEDDSHLAN